MSRFGELPDDTRPTLSGRFSRLIERTFDSVKNWYGNVLGWGLQHKATVLVATLVLFFASFALIPTGFIGFAFMPETDKGEYTVTLDMNPQMTLYQNNQVTMLAEKIIKNIPEVESIYTNVGMSGTTNKNNVTTISKRSYISNSRTICNITFVYTCETTCISITTINNRTNFSTSIAFSDCSFISPN